MREEKEIKTRLLAVIATMLETKDFVTLKQMKDTLEWVLNEDVKELETDDKISEVA